MKAINRCIIPALLLLLLSGTICPPSDAQSTVGKDSCRAYIIYLEGGNNPLPENYREMTRYNFFGICWNGKPEDNLKFARQMGYNYVMYQNGMENSPLASDIGFYFESPEYPLYALLGVDRTLSLKKEYNEKQKLTYQKYFALKSNGQPFPENIASGWFSGEGFSVEPDWQQKKVADYFVSVIRAYSRSREKPERGFLFGGLAWDVPQLPGDFYSDGKQITLAHWNGKDSSALFPGNVHDYRTYSEGRLRYYLAVKRGLAEEYPGRTLTFIFEPYNFYESWFRGLSVFPGKDQVEMMENAMIIQECGKTKWASGTEFVDDERVFSTGLISRTRTGSTTPDNHDFQSNRLIAAKAAVNGAWFSWYGRFSGSGDRIPMKNITEVPNWLQLIRVVPNWDNLSGVPLEKRSWDGAVYSSPNSTINEGVIYSRQPGTNKLFVVFLNPSGRLNLNKGEKIVSIYRADEYFCESGDAAGELKIQKNTIKLR